MSDAALPKSESKGWLAPVFFGAGFIFLYFMASPLLGDTDVPWHLATGKLLLQTHRIPVTDPWSFASNGAPWYLLSWLWDALLGMVEHMAGAYGVFLFTILLFSGLLAGLAYHLQSFPISQQALFLTMILVMLCMVEFATARPHLAGYLLIVAFCHLLHKSRRRVGYGSLWLLPPLMMLWVNAHGSFLAGFTLLGAYGIEAIAHGQHAWLKRLLVISLLCIIAALINPYGIGIITGAMQSIDSDLRAYIIEWQPFAFGTSVMLSLWVSVFVLSSNLGNRHIPLANKILAFAWFLAALMIIRNTAIFVLVSAPYLASCLDAHIRAAYNKPAPSPLISLLDRQPLKRLWACSIAFVSVFATLSAFFPHQERIQSETHSMDDVIAYILSHEPDRRYLSGFDLGGQLIYRTGSDIAFFMDSRSNTAYSSREMKRYLAFWLLKPGWEEALRPYDINGIIAHNGSRFVKAYANGQYHGHWHLVFAGKLASVYIAAP